MKVRELRALLLDCDQDAEVIAHPFIDVRTSVRTGPIHPTKGIAHGTFKCSSLPPLPRSRWGDGVAAGDSWVAVITTDVWGMTGRVYDRPDDLTPVAAATVGVAPSPTPTPTPPSLDDLKPALIAAAIRAAERGDATATACLIHTLKQLKTIEETRP